METGEIDEFRVSRGYFKGAVDMNHARITHGETVDFRVHRADLQRLRVCYFVVPQLPKRYNYILKSTILRHMSMAWYLLYHG